MANKQVVSTVFKAKDSISPAFRRMGKNSRKFGESAESSFKKASRGAKKFQNITKSILQASAVQKSFSLLTEGVNQAVTSFVSFDDSLFSAAAKFKDVNLETAKGQEMFKRLGDAARQTGKDTQFGADQAAQGLDFLALAGFSAEQAMAALPGLADLATAAGIDDFGRVVDIASDSLGAFGLASDNAVERAMNLRRVSDVLSKTMTSTNTSIETLFESIGKGAASFIDAGQSMETFSAFAGVMANSTLKGARAGTALRNIMVRLAKPSKEAAKTIRRLGIVTADQNGNFRNAIDIFSDVEKGLVGMGTAQRSNALATIFGTEQITAVSILLKEGSKSLRKWETGLINSAGATEKMAEIMRRSLGNRIKSLLSAATEAAFKFFDAFKTDGVDALSAFTEAVRKMDMGALISTTKGVVSITSNLFTILKSLLTVFSPLIAATVAYKTVIIATAIAQKAMAAGVFIYQLLTNSLKATMLAQVALNVAMSLNPVGAVIAGVTVLIATIVLLARHWSTVKKAFVDGGNAILNIFTKIRDIHKSVFSSGLSFLFGSEKSDTAGTANGPQVFSPPNKSEAESQAQRFEGILSFENKPDNVSFRSKSIGAPLINIEGLGAN